MSSPSFDDAIAKGLADAPDAPREAHVRAGIAAQARSRRIWAAVGIIIALALLLGFYGVVTAVAKRAELQKAQATQQAQVFWRCIELPDAEQRRACHERNATSPDRPAAAQPQSDAPRFAKLRN
jgi:hypothetical protein